jgi:hypothetical protein
MEVIMKKQLLTVIALGSLLNLQAMNVVPVVTQLLTKHLFKVGVGVVGSGAVGTGLFMNKAYHDMQKYIADELAKIQNLKNNLQTIAEAAKATAEAAEATAGNAEILAQGARTLAQDTAKELKKLAAQAPVQEAKQTILEQIQKVGFMQFAKNTARDVVDSDAFPYVCCAVAAFALEPVVTRTVRWIHTKWVGERPIQQNLVPVIELRNASPQHAFDSISVKQQQVTRRQYDAAALQDALHTTNNALDELLLVCDKIDERRAEIHINTAENRERITHLRTRITEITDTYNAALVVRPIDEPTVMAARNIYIEEAIIILGNSNREAHRLCLISNRFDRHIQAQLFPAPTAPRTSFFTPSEMTKRRAYTLGLFGALCAGYKFITS